MTTGPDNVDQLIADYESAIDADRRALRAARRFMAMTIVVLALVWIGAAVAAHLAPAPEPLARLL